uniref:TNase-like domain-containing protein n=1 Tax=viral metagenome TaxID=1070528 RepID=A0A6C0JV32_9ZZZZ
MGDCEFNCTEEDRQLLIECTSKGVKTFKVQYMSRVAKCVKVYDGDTATFAMRLSPGLPIMKWSCRFAHIDTAEIRSKDEEMKREAMKTRDYVAGLILDQIVRLRFIKHGKYRPVVEVYLEDGTYLNQLLLDEGYAKPYSGSGPKPY